MMTLGRAVLELVTDPAQMHQGLTNIKGEAQAALDEGKTGSVGSVAKTAMLGIAAIGVAALAVGTTMLGFAEKAAATADEVRKLARETGLTTEEASKLRFAGEKLGLDTDSLSKSFGIFSKNIDLHAAAMHKLGIEVVKTKDGHIDLEATIGNVAEQFKNMPDGVEKTALAMQLFGKSGKDMIPLLNQGKDGLAAMGDEAAKMGLVFSKDGVESARKMGLAQKELGERVEGITNTIGMALIPVVLTLFTWFGEMADVVGPAVIAIFTQIQGVFAAFGDILGVVTGQSPAAGAGLKAIAGEGAAPLMSAMAALRDVFQNVGAAIGTVIAFLEASIMPFVRELIGDFMEFVSFVQPKVEAAFQSIGQKITWVIQNVVVPIVTFLTQFWRDHFEQISAVVGAVMTAIQMVVLIAFEIVTGLFSTFMDLLSGNWQGAWDDMVGMLSSIWEKIQTIFESLGEIGKNLGAMAMDLGKSIINGLLDALGSLKDQLWSSLTSAISGAMQSIRIDLGPLHFSGASGFSLDMPHFPGFAAGTDYVPRTGLAIVHQGERIITADDNARGDTGSSDAAGHGHPIYMDGALVGGLLGRRTMRGAELAGAPLG